MALAKMLLRIAFLIMTSATYVEGIRNTGSKDFQEGSSQPEIVTTTQQSTLFQPPELLDFTVSDAGFSSSGNPTAHRHPFHVPAPDYSQPERYSPEAKLVFPSKQQKQSVPATLDDYNGNNNYNVPLGKTISTPLPSTPIRTYLDPYTNENFPSSASNVQEFTVHSTMRVQNSQAPTYHRITPAPPPPPQSSPHSYFAPQASQVAYKYDRLSYSHNPHPNALPGSDGLLLRPSTAAPRLSYASQDYLTPSYLRPNQSPLQKQDFPQTASSTVAASNYANNYSGNYLQGERYESQHQQQKPPDSYYAQPPYSYFGTRPHFPTSPGGPTRPAQSPGHNTNFLNFQQGEMPPPAVQSYRPPPPIRPVAEPPQQAGLASLASLLSSTQQFAPQISQLGSLLGVFSGTGGASAAPPMNTQLIKALENIARNDDLQCVPNVLCQLIAGQTQRGQLPTFLTSPAITSFLASFPAASPVLIYGRAALLGISGGVPSCVHTYARCPKSEDEILFYLNNHRGGFFKFFSEPEQDSPKPQNSPSASSSSSSSFFSILSLLTGNPPTTTTPPPPPKSRPTKATADLTSSIGNFFSNVLSGYVGKVEHQRRGRRGRRSLDADSDEKEISSAIEQEARAIDFQLRENRERANGSNEAQQIVADSRMDHRDLVAMDSKGALNLNEDRTFRSDNQLLHPSNGFNYEQAGTQHFEKMHFHDDNDDPREARTDLASIVVTEPRRGVRMIYTGSFEEFARRGRILNRPSYPYRDIAGGTDDQDRLVVSVRRRPHYAPESSATNYDAQRGTTDWHHYGRPQPQSHDCNNANSPHNYKHPKDDCLDNNRDRNHSQRTTQRPREDDKNIYVTNSKGLNEYYVTPDGKRVYV